jgi:DNA helicase-2/ATP-dependent DNA helicase PcrA
MAQIILDESGYTEHWRKDKSVEAAGRLDNLKELVKALEEFENLQGFLEHVSLVMDAAKEDAAEKVTLMTLHAAKGLEFAAVFLPGWEDGLFPSQRSMDESGLKGLEEERRLAYVGIHGLWQSTIPSRFLDELPTDHVDVAEPPTSYGGHGGYGTSRFDRADTFSASRSSPGWRRAQANQTEATRGNWGSRSGVAVERIGYGETDSGFGAGKGSVKGRVIEGELIAKSVADEPSAFAVGDRVFHLKFGNGNITAIEGNKLTIAFDKAGEKKVLDGFVEVV